MPEFPLDSHAPLSPTGARDAVCTFREECERPGFAARQAVVASAHRDPQVDPRALPPFTSPTSHHPLTCGGHARGDAT